MLSVREIHTYYGESYIIQGVSLDVEVMLSPMRLDIGIAVKSAIPRISVTWSPRLPSPHLSPKIPHLARLPQQQNCSAALESRRPGRVVSPARPAAREQLAMRTLISLSR
jgi:hypothetical protein